MLSIITGSTVPTSPNSSTGSPATLLRTTAQNVRQKRVSLRLVPYAMRLLTFIGQNGISFKGWGVEARPGEPGGCVPIFGAPSEDKQVCRRAGHRTRPYWGRCGDRPYVLSSRTDVRAKAGWMPDQAGHDGG